MKRGNTELETARIHTAPGGISRRRASGNTSAQRALEGDLRNWKQQGNGERPEEFQGAKRREIPPHKERWKMTCGTGIGGKRNEEACISMVAYRYYGNVGFSWLRKFRQ
ncbi:hypothetical protein D3Z45_04795 [Lachnospiraceae bacterium]|nr:hypothetical protein [Lachnospiraceae bacterium]